MKSTALLLLALLLTTTSSVSWYHLVLHDQELGGACLDGSAPGMYIHEGNGQNKKFLIYFPGGGFCGGETLNKTLENCYARSLTFLGSTNPWPVRFEFEGNGILSPAEKDNPNFHDWTKIYVLYCDGAEHQGYRENPVVHKGKTIYFRGSRNTLEQFAYLDKKYDFYNQEKIVIAGSAIGGIAAYEWTQYLYEHTKTSKVYSLPDSGLAFMNYTSPLTKKENLRRELSNLLNFVGQDENELPTPVKMCHQKIHDLPSCHDPSNIAEFIDAPMFIIQSPYDEWGIGYQVEAKCYSGPKSPYSLEHCNKTSLADIEKYRETVVQTLHKMKGGRKTVGVWGPACVFHAFLDQDSYDSSKFKVPDKTGLELYEAISKFLEDPDNAPWLLDEGQWPSNNTGCNGLSSWNLVSE